MTSKERVRAAAARKYQDRVPANFVCAGVVTDRLMREYGFSDVEALYQKFEIDTRPITPDYIGPALLKYEEDGDLVTTSYWGNRSRRHWTGKEYNYIDCHYPLEEASTAEEVLNYSWPSPDWFDYEGLKRKCDQHSGKALIFGSPGPFQVATSLRPMEKLLSDMALKPELVRALFDKMVEWELEYYERCFLACDGQLDILQTHDDYGTQISMLFSLPMWRDFIAENTRKLTALAHKNGAFFQQHSCGAVGPLIPDLIACGVDILDPIQKIHGLEPETLTQYGKVLSFQGGIDTQTVLPNGTPAEVAAEVRRYIAALRPGYVLMASQTFEPDVPTENIEAVYRVDLRS